MRTAQSRLGPALRILRKWEQHGVPAGEAAEIRKWRPKLPSEYDRSPSELFQQTAAELALHAALRVSFGRGAKAPRSGALNDEGKRQFSCGKTPRMKINRRTNKMEN
jgi:hypothetical protein